MEIPSIPLALFSQDPHAFTEAAASLDLFALYAAIDRLDDADHFRYIYQATALLMNCSWSVSSPKLELIKQIRQLVVQKMCDHIKRHRYGARSNAYRCWENLVGSIQSESNHDLSCQESLALLQALSCRDTH